MPRKKWFGSASGRPRETGAERAHVAVRVLRLAREEWPAAGIVAALGVIAASFEAMGLSFLIPLAQSLAQGGGEIDLPALGPLLAWSGTRLDGVALACVAAGLFLTGVVVNYVNMTFSNRLATSFAHRLRVRVFETALDRPISSVEGLASGDFFNALASETWRVNDALFLIIKSAVQLLYCVVLVAFLLAISPFNTLLLVTLTLASGLAIHILTRAVRDMGAAAVAANEALIGYLWDAVAGIRVIRGFGREDYERERFERRSRPIRDVFVRLGAVSNLVGPLSQIMAVGAVGSIVGISLLRGDPLADLVGFLAIAYRLQPRVSAVMNAQTALRALDASVRAVERILDCGARPAADGTEGETAGGTAARACAAAQAREQGSPDALRSGLVLRGVSARYPGAARLALEEIDCRFAAGEVTAVAGRSGAGKSTLVGLLLGFVEPERGEILVDGARLDAIDAARWRRRIAFVEQNAFLFGATVRENIGYGDLEADFDAIRRAARMAQADGFIAELPQGYDTTIGDKGWGLSQGQRQRVALARALVRDPVLLILDEATNALDAPTERAMRAAIESERGKRAVIVIAHRRETIEAADRVVVLEAGRVAQTGRPCELAAKPGPYMELFEEAKL